MKVLGAHGTALAHALEAWSVYSSCAGHSGPYTPHRVPKVDVASIPVPAGWWSADGTGGLVVFSNRITRYGWAGGDSMRQLVGVCGPSAVWVRTDDACVVRDAMQYFRPRSVLLDLVGPDKVPEGAVAMPMPRASECDPRVFYFLYPSEGQNPGHDTMYEVNTCPYDAVLEALTGHPCLQCVWLNFQGSHPYAQELVARGVAPMALGWGHDLYLPKDVGPGPGPGPGSGSVTDMLRVLPTGIVRARAVLEALRAMKDNGATMEEAVVHASTTATDLLFEGSRRAGGFAGYQLDLKVSCTQQALHSVTAVRGGMFVDLAPQVHTDTDTDAEVEADLATPTSVRVPVLTPRSPRMTMEDAAAALLTLRRQ